MYGSTEVSCFRTSYTLYVYSVSSLARIVVLPYVYNVFSLNRIRWNTMDFNSYFRKYTYFRTFVPSKVLPEVPSYESTYLHNCYIHTKISGVLVRTVHTEVRKYESTSGRIDIFFRAAYVATYVATYGIESNLESNARCTLLYLRMIQECTNKSIYVRTKVHSRG